MESRSRSREQLRKQANRVHKYREQELTRLESLMETFDRQEQKRRSACIAEHRRELTRIGHDHPKERKRLLAAHTEELAGLDQDIGSRRTAYLAKLERSHELCFRPWTSAGFEQFLDVWQPSNEERRDFLMHQFDALGNSRATRKAACGAWLGQLDVQHRLTRARRVAEHQLELADIGYDQPDERATLLAVHTRELVVLDQDACSRCAEYRAVKEEWMRVRDRSDRVYVDWLVTCLLPDANPDTRQWVEETVAEFRSVTENEPGIEVAATS